MNSRENLTKLLVEAGVPQSSDRAWQFLAYLQLLEKWGARIDLTGSVEWRIVGTLFEEAIWAAGFYPEPNGSHLDIGSGAGFPAIPLRILHPSIRLEMVESRGRRAVFLEHVVRELGLANTRVCNRRLRNRLSAGGEETWDCISWKGVKLNGKDFALLLERGGAATEFWMFHAAALPLERPEVAEVALVLQRRERFPRKRDWQLSIYRKR